MINKKNDEKTNAKYDVKVNKARYIKQEEKEETISFDIQVNGIKIYGMIYRSGVSSMGKDYELISFPARKGTDDNYYDHCWFPISKELMEGIKEQIAKVVK